jgi:RNA polymerase sigma factor (sigma-70 family)
MAALFIEHNRALRSFLRARLGTTQDAEDVAQEAYARLLQLGQPGAIGYLRAYLFKTAAHIAIDRVRQQQSRSKLDLEVLCGSDELQTTPEQEVEAAGQMQVLEHALRELPVRYRRAFYLSNYEGWTTAQIAKDMQIKERMARQYVGKSTVYCKRRLEGVSARDAYRDLMT